MGGTFSPESMARISALETPATKANVLSPVSAATLNPNSGNEVIRQSPESFTGTSYFDLDNPADPVLQQVRQSEEWKSASEPEKRRIEQMAIEQANKDLFERTGESALKIGDFEIRTNQVTDPETGEPRTEAVPRSDIGPIGRTIAGGAMANVRDMGAFIEWGADELVTQPIAAIAEALLGTKDNPISHAANTNFIKENFPTLPADNPTEKLGQEILSIVMGSVEGAGVAGALDDMAGLSQSSAHAITQFFNQAKKTDPANAAQKTQLFIRAVLQEQGMNAGAAVTTADSLEPMVQEGIFGTDIGKGALPEELKVGDAVIINEADMDNIGHFIDNNLFSAGIGVLAGIGKGVKGVANRVVPGLNRLTTTEQKLRIETGLQTLKAIDPNMGERQVALPMLAQAAKALGEVLERNKDFNAAVYGEGAMQAGGTLNLNSTTALQLGAKEYIESVYGFRKAFMSADDYARQVDEDVSKFVENLITLKQSRVGSTIINQADSAMTGQMNRMFGDEASAIGSVNEAEEGARIAAQPIVDDLQRSRQILSGATKSVENATFEANLAQNSDRVIGMLEEAKRSGILGSDVKSKEAMRRLTGKQLLDAVVARRTEVNDLFNAIPNSVTVDNEALVSKITSLATTPNPLSRLGVPQAERQFSSMTDEFLNDLVTQLDERPMTFRELFVDQRRALSEEITARKNAGKPFDQLVELKKYIDDLAADQVASGDPATKKAMEAYIKFQQDFAPTEELGRYLDVAGNYAPNSVPDFQGLRKGELEAKKAGMELWTVAENFTVPEEASALMNLLQQGASTDITAEVAEIYTGLALKALGFMDQGSTINAGQLKAAIEPYRAILEQTGSPTLAAWDNSIAAIEAADQGLGNAQTALREAQVAAQATMERAKEQAVSKFINNISGNAEVLDNPRNAFYEIFKDRAAPNMVRELMSNAEVQNNPLLKAGIQSQFWRYLKDTALTNTAIGVAGDGARVVEPGGTALNRILSGGGDNTLQTLRAIFKDEPRKADAIEGMLNIMNLAVNAKAVRPGPRGSTTMLDSGMQQSVNRMLTIAFGVLNPTATKIKAVSGAITGNYNAKLQDTILKMLDMGISNPDFLKKSMDLLEADASGTTLAAYFNKTLGVANNLLFKGALNTTKSMDENQTPQDMWNQTQEWFNGNNQNMIDENMNNEMNELFNPQ